MREIGVEMRVKGRPERRQGGLDIAVCNVVPHEKQRQVIVAKVKGE